MLGPILEQVTVILISNPESHQLLVFELEQFCFYFYFYFLLLLAYHSVNFYGKIVRFQKYLTILKILNFTSLLFQSFRRDETQRPDPSVNTKSFDPLIHEKRKRKRSLDQYIYLEGLHDRALELDYFHCDPSLYKHRIVIFEIYNS